MKLFYCPICYKEEIRNDDSYKNERTIVNVRGGCGRPITHYKCECGNYLAGSMDVSDWERDENMIRYAKEIITGYNKDGCYYTRNCLLNGSDCDLIEMAKQCYEKRKEERKERAEV